MNQPSRLYFGDCLDVMQEYIPDESVDLIYLDPPFNSKRLYNAFIGGAQWVAFDDTWQWHEAVEDFHAVAGKPAYGGLMDGLQKILGHGPSLAYLSYMANRLMQCRRVLKPTGSIYLHCDPTMSHYLKVVMDGLFGQDLFQAEINWQRTSAHNDSTTFGNVSDKILLYGNQSINVDDIRMPLDPAYIKSHYSTSDKRGKYATDNLTGPGLSMGDSGKPWGQYDPSKIGRCWSVPKTGKYATWIDQKVIPGYQKINSPLDRLDALQSADLLLHVAGATVPRLKRYLQANPGQVPTNSWADIPPVNSQAKERLGYPTQKPIALLERIIKASSNPDNVVLDPFCGCGTAIHAAQNLDRSWIGIDICVNACKIIEARLRGHFNSLWSDIEFIGIPKTRDDARDMARNSSFHFEKWAASLIDGMEGNKKQTKDKGIDGRGRIPIKKGQFIDVVAQVKGGNTGPDHVQAFNGARQQAKADLGIFTCFEDRVTVNMRDAAASTGQFMGVPVVQIYTIEDYFEGRRPAMPVPVLA